MNNGHVDTREERQKVVEILSKLTVDEIYTISIWLAKNFDIPYENYRACNSVKPQEDEAMGLVKTVINGQIKINNAFFQERRRTEDFRNMIQDAVTELNSALNTAGNNNYV